MSDQSRLLRQVRLALQNQDYNQAIDGLKQAARLAHQAKDTVSEGRHLGNLALIYYRLGRREQALYYSQKALMQARSQGDRVTEDGLLGNMGNILRELGRLQEAAEYLNQALLIAQEIGDVRGRGLWLGNLGLVFDDLKQYAKAVEYHEQAVHVARELRDQKGLASRLSNLGNSYISLGDYGQAVEFFIEVVTLCRSLGDAQALALRLGIVGNIYSELSRQAGSPQEADTCLKLALDYYQQALVIARSLGDRPSEAELLRSIGNAHGNLGNFDQAIASFQAATALFKQLGLEQQAAQAQANMALAQSYRDQSGQ